MRLSNSAKKKKILRMPLLSLLDHLDFYSFFKIAKKIQAILCWITQAVLINPREKCQNLLNHLYLIVSRDF